MILLLFSPLSSLTSMKKTPVLLEKASNKMIKSSKETIETIIGLILSYKPL